MKIIYLLIFFLFSIVCSGQKIEGIVKDSLSNEPISFIHIYSEELEIGTLSNEEGEFSFSIPDSFNSDSIEVVFSHVGYGKIIKVIHLNKYNKISILAEKIMLDEVIARNEGNKIASKISSWLKTNSARYGYGFYRQVSYQDTLATEYVEAFYKVSVSRNEVKGIKQNQARFARKKTTKESPYMIFQNFPFATTMIKIISGENSSIITPFSEKGLQNYTFEIIDRYKVDEETFVIMNCNPPQLDENSDSNLWISSEVIFSVNQGKLIQYEAIINNGLGAENITGMDSEVKVRVDNSQYRWIISFDNSSGVINQIRTIYDYDYWVNNTKYPSRVESKFLIYEFTDKKLRRLSEPKLDDLTISDIEKAKYRPAFWSKNPVIKRIEKEEKIIRTFEEENAFGSYFN
ncbi:carboxypeptidase-like regulatory domain-containing protein [Marivirga tractuosa]|uniref:carboxypeptidase-like regulatory domain-containing protein n=1 Tax=Marivirga tractuosa TaxID=1006 RepID=UPI0035D12B0B